MSKDLLEIVFEILKEQEEDLVEFFIVIRNIFISTPITKEKILYFGDWLFEYGQMNDIENLLNKIFPTEFLDNDVLALIEKYTNIVRDMILKESKKSEFIEKILNSGCFNEPVLRELGVAPEGALSDILIG